MAITAADVRAITGLPDTIADDRIAPFISIAATMLNRIAVCLASKGITEQSDIDEMQKWLAAHYISISPVGKDAGLVVEEKFENYSKKTANSKVSDSMTGVMSSHYGQTANDISMGCLKAIGLRAPSIGFFG